MAGQASKEQAGLRSDRVTQGQGVQAQTNQLCHLGAAIMVDAQLLSLVRK